MKTWTTFETDTIFQFGKYKGKTLEEIAIIDASYIYWCAINIDKFLIDEKLFLSYQHKYMGELDLGMGKDGKKVILFSNCYNVDPKAKSILKNRWEEFENRHCRASNYYDYSYSLDHDSYSIDRNSYYNDNLDMDQQDPEFWDSF